MQAKSLIYGPFPLVSIVVGVASWPALFSEKKIQFIWELQ